MSKEHKNTENPTNNDPPQGPMIQVGDIFFHKESRNVYQVIDIGMAKTDEGEEYPIIFYRGTGNKGKVMRLNIFQFLTNFQKIDVDFLSNEQLVAIKEKAEEEGQIPHQDDGLGILYQPDENFSIENMILFPETLAEMRQGINSITKYEKIMNAWGLDKIPEETKRNILNFYGASGTGKTMGAKCIANILKKPMYQVDYSQVVDKYVGETGKNIKKIFDAAKKHDAIIFLDEADALTSKRVDMSVNSDYANSVNQNRTVLMQEIDRFSGIVIMSTNFFNNYDPALLRRINRHIEFKLPDEAMKEKLYKLHIPNLDRAKSIDFKKIAKLSKGFSGGDIRNVCLNSMTAASLSDNEEDWNLTEEIFIQQINSIKKSKDEHKKVGSNNRVDKKKFMGFSTGTLLTQED